MFINVGEYFSMKYCDLWQSIMQHIIVQIVAVRTLQYEHHKTKQYNIWPNGSHRFLPACQAAGMLCTVQPVHQSPQSHYSMDTTKHNGFLCFLKLWALSRWLHLGGLLSNITGSPAPPVSAYYCLLHQLHIFDVFLQIKLPGLFPGGYNKFLLNF